MKRLISLALILILVICMSACTPNNVISPDTPDTPQTPPVQNNEPQPEPEPQKPEQPTDVEPKPEVELRYVKVGDKKREDVFPKINLTEICDEAAAVVDLKDAQLTIYSAERDAFSVGNMNDKAWINAAAEKLGLKIKQNVYSDNTLYSAQLIAQKSGMSLDIITTLISDMIPTMSLMKSATALKEDAKSLPFSKRVFDLSDGRVFTGFGNAKMLWYNKDIVADSKAFDLFTQGVWDTAALSQIKNGLADKNMIECSNWASFGSAGGVQAIGFTPDKQLVCNLGEQTVIDTFKTFAEIFSTVSDDKKTFKNGNTAFVYTDSPSLDKGMLGFVPIPSFSQNGTNVSELCGIGLGISKTASEEITPKALTFVLLWAARYSEARVDSLVFDKKISKTQADTYIDFCETNGGLYNCDRVIASYFTNPTIPDKLYTTPEQISVDYAKVFDRVTLLNSKNQ